MANLTATQRQAYIDKVAAIALRIAPKYGYHIISVVIAQCCKEPGFGTSELAINANNILGIKLKYTADGKPRTPIAIGGYSKASHEYVNGVNVINSSTFAVFSDISDCIEGYFQFLTSSSAYAGSESATDVDTYLKCIKSYATAETNPNGKTYTQSLKEDFIIPYNLTKYDAMLNQGTNVETKKIKIMLDAGHDSFRNQSPVFPPYNEATFAWKLQTYLKEELEQYGFVVDTTRATQNEVLDVVPRGKKAKGYDLFISLHSDACATESVDRPSGIFLAPDVFTDIDEKSEAITVLLTDCVRTTMGTKQAAKNYYKLAGYDRNGNGITTDDDYYGVLYGCHSVGVSGLILEHSFHTNLASAKWLYWDENIKLLAKNEAKVIALFYKTEKVYVDVDKKVTDTVIYTIKKGDTLGAIAKKFGTTVAEICALNPHITNPNLIQANKPLTIPSTVKELPVTETQTEYIVQRGDTLSGIAKKFGTTYIKLALLNGIVNPNKIYPTQVIKIK